MGASTAGPSAAAAARPRPVIRTRPGRTLTLVGLALVGAGAGFRYVARTIRDNELAQKNSGTPNFYVSVDRSGGGV